MYAYRKYITITDPDHLELGKVPFKAGQRVEIVILAEETPDLDSASIQRLFAETQALAQAEVITDEDIAKETTEWRKDLFKGLSGEEISRQAMEFQKTLQSK